MRKKAMLVALVTLTGETDMKTRRKISWRMLLEVKET